MNKVIANFHISLIYEDSSYTAYDITQRMKSDKYGKVTENVINEWEHEDDVYFKEYSLQKLVVMDKNAYIINESYSLFLCKVEYVHEFQHLLFGLGINHKMEV